MFGFSLREFSSGLSRQILLWFLLLVLLPLSVISWLGYQNARDILQQETEKSFEELADLKIDLINAAIKSIRLDLVQESDRMSNIRLIRKLATAFKESAKPVDAFVGSFSWEMILDQQSNELTSFWNTMGYYDVLLIDPQGNILFSFLRESDLGRNLFNDPQLSSSRFARAAQKSLKTGQVSFSDLELYAPSSGGISGFMTNAMLDENGEIIGVLAFQLAGKPLNQLLGEDIHFGNTGRRYLVGADFKLRTPNALGDNSPVLQASVKPRPLIPGINYTLNRASPTPQSMKKFPPTGVHRDKWSWACIPA